MAYRTFAVQKQGIVKPCVSPTLRSRPFAPSIQAKLTVGQPNDQYEQEADSVADSVIGRLQRMENPDEQELQMKPDLHREVMPQEKEEVMVKSEHSEKATASQDVESTINQKRGSGSALPSIFRSKIEQAIGANFSDVRVHTDQESDTLNRSLSARAFTTGNDIFFKQGEYDPTSIEGQKLLTHELTHTVQQNPNLAQRKTGTTASLSSSASVEPSMIQMKKGKGFLAGVPSAWHVHYDHVKYGNNGSTRVNFFGRTSEKVLKELNEILDEQPGLKAKEGLNACIKYIKTYV